MGLVQGRVTPVFALSRTKACFTFGASNTSLIRKPKYSARQLKPISSATEKGYGNYGAYKVSPKFIQER